MADKENYYIPVDGKLVEVEETVYTAYYKMSRRERYLEERDQENGVMSYDALDHNGMVGQEAFQDGQWLAFMRMRASLVPPPKSAKNSNE